MDAVVFFSLCFLLERKGEGEKEEKIFSAYQALIHDVSKTIQRNEEVLLYSNDGLLLHFMVRCDKIFIV